MRKSSDTKYHVIEDTKYGTNLKAVVQNASEDDDDNLSTPEFSWLACVLGLVFFSMYFRILLYYKRKTRSCYITLW